MGMESGKVLAVNSMARIEHVEIDSADLNQGFEKFAQHLKQNGLSWPQLLASAFRKNAHYDDLRFGVARHFAAQRPQAIIFRLVALCVCPARSHALRLCASEAVSAPGQTS